MDVVSHVSSRWLSGLVVLGLELLHLGAFAASVIPPGGDNDVIEVLPAVTRNRPITGPSAPKTQDLSAVVLAVRQDISMARHTGETRYWGRAQAALAPWWDQANAPADMAVLQATVQQGRHEFDASRKVLEAALVRAPQHAQGWLNLASLERLSARYAQSLVACDAVARAGQALYANACVLETLSLQGQHARAAQGFTNLIAQTRDRGQLSWLQSLLAENEERAGRDNTAAQAYQRSLAFDADLYTSIAYSDLLLRTDKPSQALKALAGLPETDAVLLRRAAAWKRTGDGRWLGARSLLQERMAELKRRGDDPALHGRELALAALWLDEDPAAALLLAKANLQLQREPLDWWVAVHSALAARDAAALKDIETSIRAVGLQDMRLAKSTPKSAGKP